MSNYRKKAELRFAVIGELLASPPDPGELEAKLVGLSQKTWKDGDGKQRTFSKSTIERWYYGAKNADSPLKALMPKVRHGQPIALISEMVAELERSYQTFPSWSTQLHYDNFRVWLTQNEGLKAEAPSYASVRRLFRRRGWRRVKRVRTKEIRSFEVPHVGGLWHLDFHHGRRLIVAPSGQRLVPICLAIMDDCSRLCCHLQWFFHEDTRVLVHGFCQALLKRGLPRALLTDNGSAMVSAEFTEGLMRLGIQHETTLPYSPHQNGKQESFWGNLEGRLMSMLEKMPHLSLEKLNQLTLAWAEMEYNRLVHSAIKSSPMEKWQMTKSVMRSPSSLEYMRRSFRQEAQRKVRFSDGTFSLEGKRFEVPLQYRSLERVTVHFARWDLSLIDLVDPKTKAVLCPIYPVDLEKNANQRRKTLPSREEQLWLPGTESEPGVPPLLQKLIADYASVGTPIPYIPLEEKT